MATIEIEIDIQGQGHVIERGQDLGKGKDHLLMKKVQEVLDENQNRADLLQGQAAEKDIVGRRQDVSRSLTVKLRTHPEKRAGVAAEVLTKMALMKEKKDPEVDHQITRTEKIREGL